MSSVVWLEEVRNKDVPLVGGKGASLGEMINAGPPIRSFDHRKVDLSAIIQKMANAEKSGVMATLRILKLEKDYFIFDFFAPNGTARISKKSIFQKIYIDQEFKDMINEIIELIMDPVRSLDQSQLERQGSLMYNYCIPKEIREAIEKVSPEYLMIETGDLFIPWELAYDGNQFWAEKYKIGKRVIDDLPDNWTMNNDINTTGKWTCVVLDPKNYFLDKDKEIKIFKDIGADIKKNLQKKQLLVFLITEKNSVLHIICHGIFNRSDPLRSKIIINEKETLNADEIRRIKVKAFLVFINACYAAQHEDKYGFIGLVKSFLESDIQACIAPIWSIPDPIAAYFSTTFYRSLLQGKTLGESMIIARKKTKQKYGGVYGLIYTLYGDPTLKLCHDTHTSRVSETLSQLCQLFLIFASRKSSPSRYLSTQEFDLRPLFAPWQEHSLYPSPSVASSFASHAAITILPLPDTHSRNLSFIFTAVPRLPGGMKVRPPTLPLKHASMKNTILSDAILSNIVATSSLPETSSSENPWDNYRFL